MILQVTDFIIMNYHSLLGKGYMAVPYCLLQQHLTIVTYFLI